MPEEALSLVLCIPSVYHKVINGVARDWDYPELSGYSFISYNKAKEMADDLSSGFIKLGMKPVRLIHSLL